MHEQESIPGNPTQYKLFLALSFLVVVLVGLQMLLFDPLPFRKYFGSIPPLLAPVLVATGGLLAVRVFISFDRFPVFRGRDGSGWGIAAAAASLFGLAIIAADFFILFPEDINVPFPQSMLFYPAIAFIVEIVFHLIPLALLLLLVSSISKASNADQFILPILLIVALLEPVYQVLPETELSAVSGTDLYVGLHIFLINLCQLWLFRRYDFLHMYLFRLVYYAIWHIGWGWLRLEVLF